MLGNSLKSSCNSQLSLLIRITKELKSIITLDSLGCSLDQVNLNHGSGCKESVAFKKHIREPLKTNLCVKNYLAQLKQVRKCKIKRGMWGLWIVVLEKTLESPLDCKEFKPVNPKGNQPWTFIGRTDTEAEAPICYLPDSKSWLIGKDTDAGKDWRQEEKGTTEDEMVGWYHWLNGHELEQTPGGSDRMRGKPGVLQSTGSQRVRHDWATEQQPFVESDNFRWHQ